MKKIFIVMALLALALGTVGMQTAFAQGTPPPERPERGVMHEYIVAALAEKLDLTVDELNERLEAGERMYAIALAEGITEADLPVFLQEVHQAAIDAALADGAITQEWADWMTQRFEARAKNGFGTCPMGGRSFQYGGSIHRGMGGGMRGFRWFQVNP